MEKPNKYQEKKRPLDRGRLKQLCDKYKIPIHMGELWVNELRLSKLELDKPAQESAKILGLL
jgi:hypothetical protein